LKGKVDSYLENSVTDDGKRLVRCEGQFTRIYYLNKTYIKEL